MFATDCYSICCVQLLNGLMLSHCCVLGNFPNLGHLSVYHYNKVLWCCETLPVDL